MDFSITDATSFYLLTPLTECALEEVTKNFPLDNQWGGAIPVEHRYIYDVCQSLLENGFTIEKDGKEMVSKSEELLLRDIPELLAA